MCLQNNHRLLVGTGKGGRQELCSSPLLHSKLWRRPASQPSVSLPPAKEVDVPKTYPPCPDLFLPGIFQSKQPVLSSRCAGYTKKKPQGKCGQWNPTLRCWGCCRRQSFSPSLRSWGMSLSVMTTLRAPVRLRLSLFVLHHFRSAFVQTCQRELSFYSSWKLSFSKVSFNIVMQLLYFCIL